MFVTILCTLAVHFVIPTLLCRVHCFFSFSRIAMNTTMHVYACVLMCVLCVYSRFIIFHTHYSSANHSMWSNAAAAADATLLMRNCCCFFIFHLFVFTASVGAATAFFLTKQYSNGVHNGEECHRQPNKIKFNKPKPSDSQSDQFRPLKACRRFNVEDEEETYPYTVSMFDWRSKRFKVMIFKRVRCMPFGDRLWRWVALHSTTIWMWVCL